MAGGPVAERLGAAPLPAGARELADELMAVLGRWHETRQEEGRPLVHVLLDPFPLKEYPL